MSERALTIITWGRAFRDSCPSFRVGKTVLKTEHNFNAAVIADKPRNVNLRRLDGRSEELQEVFLRNRDFQDFVETIRNFIEERDLHVISINCRKGRHRSVSAAEVLKRLHYPKAQIYHYERGV